MDARVTPVKHRPIFVMAGAVIVVGSLYFGRELFIPLALAILFSLVLSPGVSFLERKARLGSTLSVLLVVGTFLGTIVGATWLVGAQAAHLVDELPKYRETLVEKARGISSSFHSTFGRASEAVEKIAEEASKTSKGMKSGGDGADGAGADESGTPRQSGEEGSQHEQSGVPSEDGDASVESSGPEEKPVRVEVVSSQFDVVSTLGAYLGPVMHPLATLSAALVLLMFFLYNRDDLRDRIIRLCGQASVPVTIDALGDCARRVRRFLMAQACANGIIGVFIGVGLHFMGLPNAALWGLIAAVARFLPYIGTFIAAALPFALAVAQFDGWQVPILVVSWCIFVDILSANTLEPWLYGARTGLAPTAILFAFMFWTWLWGGFGLFLATPITVCLVVMGKHIPAMGWIYLLLTDDPVLEPAARFYQRLLGRNEASALDVAEAYAKESGAIEMLDDVVLPGLAQVKADHQTGVVDDDRIAFSTKVVEKLLERRSAESEQESMVPATMTVALVPGPGGFDRLLKPIIEEAAEIRGIQLDVQLITGLTSEIASGVDSMSPSIVVFGAIEPQSLSRFRYVLKRLRSRNSKLKIVLLSYSGSRAGARMARRLAMEMSQANVYSLAMLASDLRRDRVADQVLGSALEAAASGSGAVIPV